jgi:hypothetical protein
MTDDMIPYARRITPDQLSIGEALDTDAELFVVIGVHDSTTDEWTALHMTPRDAWNFAAQIGEKLEPIVFGEPPEDA